MSDKVNVVHTWRDGTFIYQGDFDFTSEAMGAPFIGDREGLAEVYELRHLKGKTVADIGELFHWVMDENGTWHEYHLGKTCEEFLPEWL